MSETVAEITKFLQIGARLDLKSIALTNVLGLTGTNEGIDSLIEIPDLLLCLVSLLNDNSESVAKDSSLCLVNISAHEKGAGALLNLDMKAANRTGLQKPPANIATTCLRFVLDENSHISDPCCMILSNVSVTSRYAETVVDLMPEFDATLDTLISAFTKVKYNKRGATLHYLGTVLSNLSQCVRVRRYILDRERCVVQRLLPFVEYAESVVRRGGVVGTLRNCCFEADHHGWLLGEEVDVLPRLLLPLAGNTEYDEEDNDKLPLDLQYLPETKEREVDPDIRCMLLESVTQLCAKRENRQFVRDKNTYVILRELHKWEKDRRALLACENLVDVLIRTEEEIGEDNLKEVDVPSHLHEKFSKIDDDFLRDA